VTTIEREAPAPDAQAPAQVAKVLVAVVTATTKVGVVIDAAAPLSAQISSLLDLVNARLAELGEPKLAPDTDVDGRPVRGRWALCRIDGTPLKPGRSLAEQGVVDGTRLWLRFIADTEARIDVVEHVTTAVAAELARRWPGLTPVWAARVGTAMAVAGVLIATASMAGWRYWHPGWLASGCCLGLSAAALIAAVVILARSSTVLGRQIGDALLLTGCVPAAVGTAAAVPGQVGASQVTLGAATVLVAAVLIARFTGRYIALGTAVVVAGTAGLVIGLARMCLVTSAVTLLTSLLLAAGLGMHMAPMVARWACGIRLPVFASASGRWIFETRPDLPSTVVVASGELATLDGPESVRDVAVSADRAHGYLTGLLISTTALVVVASIGLCDPLAARRWLPLLLVGLVAVAVLLRGRSFTDRLHATILAGAAVTLVIGVAARYIIELRTSTALLVGAGVIVAVPVAGLIAAVVVPNRFFTPVFRKVVEWIEYLCLVPIAPLAFWLMGVLAAIRYRS
jgi:type VII secretion integral membrane protein EccD